MLESIPSPSFFILVTTYLCVQIIDSFSSKKQFSVSHCVVCWVCCNLIRHSSEPYAVLSAVYVLITHGSIYPQKRTLTFIWI